jgi:hypothetical protein
MSRKCETRFEEFVEEIGGERVRSPMLPVSGERTILYTPRLENVVNNANRNHGRRARGRVGSNGTARDLSRHR